MAEEREGQDDDDDGEEEEEEEEEKRIGQAGRAAQHENRSG